MSHLIFFIATLIALGIAVTIITNTLKSVTYSVNERMEITTRQASILLKIVEGYAADTNDYFIVYVKNIGLASVDVNSFDVFINGGFVGSCGGLLCIDETNNGVLSPDELLEINVPFSITPGSYRIRVVSEYGSTADYEVVVG